MLIVNSFNVVEKVPRVIAEAKAPKQKGSVKSNSKSRTSQRA